MLLTPSSSRVFQTNAQDPTGHKAHGSNRNWTPERTKFRPCYCFALVTRSRSSCFRFRALSKQILERGRGPTRTCWAWPTGCSVDLARRVASPRLGFHTRLSGSLGMSAPRNNGLSMPRRACLSKWWGVCKSPLALACLGLLLASRASGQLGCSAGLYNFPVRGQCTPCPDGL